MMPSYSRTVEIKGKTARELYDRILKEAARFAERAGVTGYELRENPDKLSVEVRSSLFNAVLRCHDARVVIEGKMSLLVAPFRGKIDREIDRMVSESFG